MLTALRTKSCGCLQREATSRAKTTHGKAGSAEHEVWKNIIANFVPIVIMDFFNFTHGLALMDYVEKAPFLSCLRDLTIQGNLKDPDIAFNLKWYMDEKETEMEKDQANATLSNPNAASTLSNRTVSLSEVFKNYNLDHFKTSLNPAFEHAMRQLIRYTQNSDRQAILSNTFSQIFELEKPLYLFLDPTLPDNSQSWKLVQALEQVLKPFFASPKLVQDYLKESKREAEANFKEFLQFDFSRHTLNWVFLINLMAKWIPANGIPSFNYYLFNTFLRPYSIGDIVLSESNPEQEPIQGQEEEELVLPDGEVKPESTFRLPLPMFYSSGFDPDHTPSIFQNTILMSS
jgi:hypothetical protein